MKHIGKVVTYLIMAVNALFVGMLILTAYSPYLSPISHPIASCLGLAFPFFLIANCCFLLFWLVARFRCALLSLVGLLICFSQIRTYIPIHTTHSLPEESIKVLSYNVMGFNGMKKENGKSPILSYLSESQADIICLQEYGASKNDRFVTDKDIARALKAFRYKNIRPLHPGGSQMACYSKYPILSARKVEYESDYNGSILYELKIDNDTICLINNHLESNKLTLADKAVYEKILKDPKATNVKSGVRQLVRKLAEASAIRSRQADVVAREIEESPHPYKIVCGDFNDASISYTHRVIAQDLDDAFTTSGLGLGISYNQNKFYFRIDNILISPNWKAYNCTVDRSIKESDHYPIWCHLTKR